MGDGLWLQQDGNLPIAVAAAAADRGGGIAPKLVTTSIKVLRTREGGQARKGRGDGMGATTAMVPRLGLGPSKGGVLTRFETCGDFFVGALVCARGKMVNLYIKISLLKYYGAT